MNSIRVQNEPLDICAIQEELRAQNPGIGAVVSFTGLMRDMNLGERVDGMLLEHYPGMTEKALQAIVSEAEQRWELMGISVVHRIGELRPLEPIVVVAVASAHRGEAFQACEFVIDYLKTRAPFWKREQTSRGGRWLEARDSDEQAERRWKNN
jgi:molybdopterin synthase catalytic subunit